jgi:hypothetical protein
MGHLRVTLQFEPKSVTIAFKHLFSEAGFGDLTVPDFWFCKVAFVRFAISILHLWLNRKASPSPSSVSLAKLALVS